MMVPLMRALPLLLLLLLLAQQGAVVVQALPIMVTVGQRATECLYETLNDG